MARARRLEVGARGPKGGGEEGIGKAAPIPQGHEGRGARYTCTAPAAAAAAAADSAPRLSVPSRSYDLERGPGRLGPRGIGLLAFVRAGLLGFDQPGLAGLGPGAFFPALVAAHLAWSVARPVAALLACPPARRRPWAPTDVKAVPAPA